MPISKRHVAALRSATITTAMIRARGYETVREDDAGWDRLHDLGIYSAAVSQCRPGLLIPLRTIRGQVWGYTYRPDEPRADFRKRGKVVKYENPVGRPLALDCPPGLRARLASKDEPLIVTEGSKKADAAMCNGYGALALLGVTMWNVREWDDLPIAGRDVFVVFDSDAVSKPEVRQQEQRLSAFLTERGARVYVARLVAQGTGKVGLDDYVAQGGDLDDLLAEAEPFAVAAEVMTR